MKCRRKSQNGRTRFTLTELLVVIGIMALMAALTTAAVAPMLQGRRLESGARTIKSLVARARSYAILHRTQTLMSFDPGEKSIQVYAGTTKSPSNRIQEPVFLPAGVDFNRDNANFVVMNQDGTYRGNQVVFSETGALDTGHPDCPLTDGDNARIALVGGEEGVSKVVEIVHTTGMTRSFDQ